jgi:translation initiation factor 2 alpha subunit (eIF-2alpha)
MAVAEKCSYYPRDCPEVGEMVVGKISEINTDLGSARVDLLEYDGVSGMLSFSELSRRRIRSIRDHLRLNQQDIFEVIASNPHSREVDLSKKNVTPQETEAALERFSQVKRVDNILRHLAMTQKVPLPDLYHQIVWPLYESSSPYEAFVRVAQGQNCLEELNIPSTLQEALIVAIKTKFPLVPQEIRAHIALKSSAKWPNPCHLDIDQIKECLEAGRQCGKPEEPMTIRLVSSPEYQLSLTTILVEAGKKTLNQAIAAISARVEAYGGEFSLIKAPFVTTPETTKIIQSESSDSPDEEESDASLSDAELAVVADAAQAKIDTDALAD